MNPRRGLALALMLACSIQAAFCTEASTYVQQAAKGVETLQSWYTPATGLYQTTGWWNSANAITVLVDNSRIAHTQQYLPVLANTFTAAQNTSKGFINNFYDDEGWWALAWIDAYDLSHSPQYLAMASSIFTDMSAGWDTNTCGGGIWWSKDKKYKNAIANELFFSVAAHLANRTTGRRRALYQAWSKREWAWFSASGMINEQNLINDGLDSSNPNACKNNAQDTWSYNQGVILGALAEYSRLTKNPSLLQSAARIAHATITLRTDTSGILHDPCEPKCGGDGPQFKGIFLRNLAQLHALLPDPEFTTFATTNADSIWNNAQGPNCTFGLNWAGPFDSADAARQSSALDAILAAAVMSGPPPGK